MKKCEEQTAIISVIMGVFRNNKPISHLEDSIRSALEQTVPPIEILICDDGSDAETKQKLNELAAMDDRIKLLREDRHSSLAHKLNLCLSYASGDWIARQDDDDISDRFRFQKELQFLMSNPKFSFVGCDTMLFDEEGIYGERYFPERPQIKDFFFKQPYLHPTLMFRRSCLDGVNGYHDAPYTELCEDYDLLLRLASAGFIGANLNEPLYSYRVSRKLDRRKMKYRLNECVTRFLRFRDLRLLPWAIPYVIKPILVGLLPTCLLSKLKQMKFK